MQNLLFLQGMAVNKPLQMTHCFYLPNRSIKASKVEHKFIVHYFLCINFYHFQTSHNYRQHEVFPRGTVGVHCHYFPIQKSLNITSNTCSTSIFPVILPISLKASLSSSAASTTSLSPLSIHSIQSDA